MKSIPRISESELSIMEVIWENNGSCLYADLMESLTDKAMDWKKNTVLTFLSRLVEKEMLSVRKRGRRNEYTALVSRQAYRAHQTKHFVEKIYGGNAMSLMSMLVSGGMVPREDVEALRKYWEGAETHE